MTTNRQVPRQVPFRGLAVGAAVSLALGAYSVVHEPTGRDFVLYGFESAAAAWKNALTLVVAVLLVAQAALAFKLAGLFGQVGWVVRASWLGCSGFALPVGPGYWSYGA